MGRADKVMHDAAFQTALQRYAHSNGSSSAVAWAALRALGLPDAVPQASPLAVKVAQLVGDAVEAELTSLDGVLGVNWGNGRDHIEVEVEDGDGVRWFRFSAEEMVDGA